MAITHFEITEIPDTNVIDSKINGAAIIIGNQYPITDQNLLTWERKSAFLNKPINTYFKYKAHNSVGPIVSNEAFGNLKWIGTEPVPESSNVVLTILNGESINLLEELPLNDAVDFIFISSMVGVQNLLVRNSGAYITQQLDIIDLFYSNFTANASGGGDPYFKLNYLVGKEDGVESTIYSLQVNIVSLAILGIISGPTVINSTEDINTGSGVVNYPTIQETTTLEISLGYALGTANVDIVINSPFLSLNAYNAVYLNYNGSERIEQDNITINADILLDEFGKAQITVKNYIVEDTADAKTGDITITLNSINTDSLLVDGTQSKNLIMSF